MYAKYTYKTTATTAQVLRDLILILTGTTNTGSLSASCDTANTTINTAYCTTGLNNDHDSGASANTTQGFRVSVWDNTSEYFYVALTITTTSLGIGIWGTWNGTTHVGVAPGAAQGVTAALPTIGTSTGVIYLWSDGKSVVISTSSANTYAMHVVQITRDEPWRTIANGCKPVVCCGNTAPETSSVSSWSANTSFTLKGVNASFALVNAGTTGANVTGLTRDVPYGSAATQTQAVSSVPASATALVPYRAGMQSAISGAYMPGGSVTQISPIFALLTTGTPVVADDVVYNSENYKIMAVGNGTTYSRVVCRV